MTTAPVLSPSSSPTSHARPCVEFRPLRRDDGPLLDEIMEGMSDQSRYQRFHVHKLRLTRLERDSLTNVDGRDRLAVVAIVDGSAVGVARVSRLKEAGPSGELSVAVVDAWQGCGIGARLISQITRRAVAAGVDELVAMVLSETGLAGSLIRRGWRQVERSGPSVTLSLPTRLATAAAT